MFVLLAHAVNIVSYEVNRLSKGICATAKNLNGLTHEFDVLLGETFASTVIHLIRCLRALFRSTNCGYSTFFTLSFIGSLLLANSSHFNLRAGILIRGRFRFIIIDSLAHHCLGLLNELRLAIINIFLLTLLLHHILIILLGRRLVFVFSITDQLLLSLLLHLLLLLLLHLVSARHFVLFLALLLSLFFLNTLLLFLLLALLGLLLLLFASFVFGALSLFISGSLLLGLVLCLHLLLLSSTIVFLLSGSTVVSSASTKDLLHVRGSIDFGCGGLEHHLEEEIGLFRFVTCDNFRWLDIKLFADDELGQLDQLDQKVDLRVLLSDRLSVELWSLEESSTEASFSHGSGKDIVEVSERGLGKQLLGHLRLLEDLRIHLSGWLPKFVSHFRSVISVSISIQI